MVQIESTRKHKTTFAVVKCGCWVLDQSHFIQILVQSLWRDIWKPLGKVQFSLFKKYKLQFLWYSCAAMSRIDDWILIGPKTKQLLQYNRHLDQQKIISVRSIGVATCMCTCARSSQEVGGGYMYIK